MYPVLQKESSKTTQVRVYGSKRKLIKISLQIPSKDYSIRHSVDAVTANFIHFCDAYVCAKMLPHSYATIHDCFLVRMGTLTHSNLSTKYKVNMLMVHKIALQTVHFNLLKLLDQHQTETISHLLDNLENTLYSPSEIEASDIEASEIREKIQQLKDSVGKFNLPLKIIKFLFIYWETLVDYPMFKRALLEDSPIKHNSPLNISWK
jgi:hypothetical protein